ncbi:MULTISPECIES: ATP-binding protein [unclassified Phenylobacterium]|uniref:sensor histidine kinase n=1 Tax=unclassified Phenylobacterium TaxID=2640670 RepID=UPI000839ED39|nr:MULTISPECIES: ATP-binding protein [unclassified Phenylobacterium]
MWWVSSEPDDGSRLKAALRQTLRYAAVIPIIALTTGVAELVYRLTGSDRLSSIFIAGVLLAAFLLGSGPAYLAAAAAFFAYFFLVDPRFQFTFGSPDDFNVLMMFLAVSALTGLLTGRVRDEAARAKARQRVNGALLDATREFSASSDEAFIRARLAHHMARAARGEAAVHDGPSYVSAPAAKLTDDAVRMLRAAEGRSSALGRATQQLNGWSLRALSAGDASLGIVAWRPLGGGSLSDEEQTVLDILVDTGAAAISRARLAAGKAEAETRARTEDLRNALLSSISHDLRTPLAAILASASSLDAFGETFDAATRLDLVTTIQEEAERLDLFVANLLNMTRLEAGALQIQRAPFNVPEVIQRTLQRRNRNHRRCISTASVGDLPEALGDPVLFEQALGNAVENAFRYTPPDSAVSVAARTEGAQIVVEVTDSGPGVAGHDFERIFEKFYRAPSASDTAGTGLGLSISRGLMTVMGGKVVAGQRSDGDAGLVVRFSLEAVTA